MAKKRQNKKQQKTQVVHKITVKAPRRETSDVGAWRQALRSADNERMTKLYDLYEDLLIDGVLSDATDKRIDAITLSDLTFQDKAGKEVDAMIELIDTPAFEQMLRLIMKRKTFGRSGFEFDFTNGFSLTEIEPQHINLKKKQILLKATDLEGVPYEKLPNVVVLGKQRDYGLFLKTAPFTIYKRGGFGDYAQWLEIFGMPQRVGKYNAYDTESRRLLEDAMERAGSAPWLVIPKEADVETTNNTGSGNSGISYNDFRKACNEEILIAMQGQTLTTIAGEKGARSLGEVHQGVSQQKHLSDMRYVQRVLNYTILPILEARGFPVSGGKFLFPKQAEPLEVSEIVQLSNIIDMPQSWIYDKYGIPIPKGDEKLAKTNTLVEQSQSIEKKAKKKGKKKKPEKPSTEPSKINSGKKKGKKPIKNSDKSILKKVYDFFVNAPKLKGAVGSHLTLSNSLSDDVIGRIDGKMPFDTALFEFFRDDFLKAIIIEEKTEELSDLTLIYGYETDAFKTAQELNIFHFSAAKTLAEVMELNRIYQESGSFEEFYKKAKKVADTFNKKWQKTEHETATLIAEGAELYQRLIKKTKLFPYWEYRTAGDDKVRPEHALLDGLILPANDPLWKKIFPPNGWKCRCYVIPRMAHEVGKDEADRKKIFEEMRKRVADYFETTEWKNSKAQGFGVNRALTSEVFQANQMYVKKFPTMAKKLLKDVTYKTYQLGSYEQNRKKATEDVKLYEGSSADFFSKLESENDKVFFRDYNNRMILFDEEKYLKGHTPKKYSVRTQYLTAAQETLKNPNEVWLGVNDKELNTYRLVRYYKDVTIVVVAETKDGKVYRIKTWFPVNENRVTARYRSGLLIKKQP